MNAFTSLILSSISEVGYDDTYNFVISDHDRTLTQTLCSSDVADFISTDETNEAWLFTYNEIINTWETVYLGYPDYQIDSEMLGNLDINPHDFTSELRTLLPGVHIKTIVNSSNGARNHLSEFWHQFQDVLEEAFYKTLDSF